jgi:hypothetical protein
MSLDNVLALAGAAREHPFILAFGLLLSIALMGLAANLIARLLQKHRWIARPAGAFIANADGVAKAATRTDAIEVKHKTPPGWHHGRKTGWHRLGKPPGHQP